MAYFRHPHAGFYGQYLRGAFQIAQHIFTAGIADYPASVVAGRPGKEVMRF